MLTRFSVAMSSHVAQSLRDHLLMYPGEEDLVFALYTPSFGATRMTGLLNRIILPVEGDRQRHGNVSFNLQYFERVLDVATAAGSGIAFLHSHVGPGWQGMSDDDVVAERRLSGPALSVTNLPLVGLTVGTDGTWSARFWIHRSRGVVRHWCETVRVSGERLDVSYDDSQLPPAGFAEMFRRTRTVWGPEHHAKIARLQIGIVGLGSVGMALAETLARSGIQSMSLIDFDEVQPHNLDRLQGASRSDIGRLKVEVAADLVRRSSTATDVTIKKAFRSVVEREGYAEALDCDVLFSCVDRPRARQILNHVAYAHLIPVIDGGIAVRFREGRFAGAEWQTQTVAPGRPCLQCLDAFSSGDADTERAGMLDDPSYMRGLPDDHHLKANENVYPFAMNLASLEMFQFISLAAGIQRLTSIGIQRFHLVGGMLETDNARTCRNTCDIREIVATADTLFSYVGRDVAADSSRRRQTSVSSAAE